MLQALRFSLSMQGDLALGFGHETCRSNARWRMALSKPMLLKWKLSMSRYRIVSLVDCTTDFLLSLQHVYT